MLSLTWALYDEFFGLRPWRSYQLRFADAYSRYLKREIPKQAAALKAIEDSPRYRELLQARGAAQEAAKPRVDEIDAQMRFVNQQLGDIGDAFTTARGK